MPFRKAKRQRNYNDSKLVKKFRPDGERTGDSIKGKTDKIDNISKSPNGKSNLSAQNDKISSSKSQKETSNIKSTDRRTQSTNNEFASGVRTNQSSLSSLIKNNESDQQAYKGSDMDLSDTDHEFDGNLIEIEKITTGKMDAISTDSNTRMITPMECDSAIDHLTAQGSKSKATKNQKDESGTSFSNNSSFGTNSSVKSSTNQTEHFKENLIKTNQTFQSLVIYSFVNNHESCFSIGFFLSTLGSK